jgi:uncharacterized RDD family membrane protein YckC
MSEEIAGSEAAPEAKLLNAEPATRALAFGIDFGVAVVLGLVPWVGGLFAAGYWLVRDGLELEFMDRRSIGKRILRIRPVTLDGSAVDLGVSARRNWMFALFGVGRFLMQITILGPLGAVIVAGVGLVLTAVEGWLVFTDPDGRRLGDGIANTRVVEES